MPRPVSTCATSDPDSAIRDNRPAAQQNAIELGRHHQVAGGRTLRQQMNVGHGQQAAQIVIGNKAADANIVQPAALQFQAFARDSFTAEDKYKVRAIAHELAHSPSRGNRPASSPWSPHTAQFACLRQCRDPLRRRATTARFAGGLTGAQLASRKVFSRAMPRASTFSAHLARDGRNDIGLAQKPGVHAHLPSAAEDDPIRRPDSSWRRYRVRNPAHAPRCGRRADGPGSPLSRSKRNSAPWRKSSPACARSWRRSSGRNP